MRLTKSTSHAIRILIDCARADDRLVKVAELSERLQITQQNVFKIVNLLARARLIEAVRGRNGGVRLARPAGAIRIGDVVRATEVTHVEIEEIAGSRKPKARGRQPDPRRRARGLHRRPRPAHAGRHGEGPAGRAPRAPRRKTGSRARRHVIPALSPHDVTTAANPADLLLISTNSKVNTRT